MNAAYHLARQIAPGRDIELKGREREADGVGQMPPAAGTKALREAVLEIIEFYVDGPFSAPSLQHLCVPQSPYRAAPYITDAMLKIRHAWA